MRHFLSSLALAAAGLAAASTATAQSMNPEQIAHEVMGDVCVPFVHGRDLPDAVAAAQALGYEIVSGRFDQARGDRPLGAVRLERRHHGVVMLSVHYARGLCVVGVGEANPASMSGAADFHARSLGLEPVIDARVDDAAISLWRAGSTAVLIAPSIHFIPGSELTVSFDTGWRPPERR